LSYGEAEWGVPALSASEVSAGGSVTVTVPVSATGARDATVVVQGYVAPIDPPVDREPKALKAWQKVRAPAGGATGGALSFDERASRRWAEAARGWGVDPGEYDLVIARSAADGRARLRVTLTS